MVYKELKNRIKKGATIKDYMVVSLLFIMCFSIVYNFTYSNVQQAGIPIDSSFNESYQRFLANQNNLTSVTNKFQNASNDITEASATEVAFFGLNGILGLMKTSLQLIPIVADLSEGVEEQFTFIPSEVTNILVLIGAVMLMMTILAFLTQRGREP